MSRPIRLLLIFLACITVFRVFYIAAFDLTPDEAYYWTWSLDLDWCYFDQPAGIAVADWLFTAIFGTTTWGLRMGAVILGLIGTLFVFLTAKRLDFSDDEAAWTAALMHLIPLMASGHVLMLHDTVMAACVAVFLYTLARALFEGGIYWWALTGVAAAASMYGKFSTVTLAFGIGAFLLLTKIGREQFRKPGPYLSAVIAAVLFAPVLLWNAGNHWIASLAVRKLAYNPDLTLGGRIANFFDFIGSQAALITPIFLVMMIIAAIAAIRNRRKPKNDKQLLMALIFSGILLYFIVQSFRAKVQGNWAALAYLPGTLLMVRFVADKIKSGNDRWLKWCKAGWVLAVLTTVVFTMAPVARIIPAPNITDQVHGWKELAARVDDEREKNPELVLMARRYQIASQLLFYCKGRPEVYVVNAIKRGNQFDLTNDWNKLEGKSVLYVDYQHRSRKLWAHFDERATGLDDFILKRGGHEIQPVHLTILEGFHIQGPLQKYFEDPVAHSAQSIKNRLAGVTAR